jgi:hypothetical protein
MILRVEIRMTCKTPDCKSKATYGFTFANPEYCIIHGKLNGAKTQFGVCCCGESTLMNNNKDTPKKINNSKN